MTDSGSKLLPSSGPFLVDAIETNPVSDSFTLLENYGLYFWQPYLGLRTFATWALIKSFAWGHKTESFPSISRLARILSNSPNGRKAINGRPDKPGTIAQLEKEQLLYITTEGEGPTAFHTFHIVKTLPLLTPTQLETLTPALQRDHAFFLRRHKIAYEEYIEAFDKLDRGGSPGPTPWVRKTHPLGPLPAGGGSPGPTKYTREEDQTTVKENSSAWSQILEDLATNYTRSAFSNYFGPCSLGGYKEGILTIEVDNPRAHDFLQNRLHNIVFRTACRHLPDLNSVQFILSQPVLL